MGFCVACGRFGSHGERCPNNPTPAQQREAEAPAAAAANWSTDLFDCFGDASACCSACCCYCCFVHENSRLLDGEPQGPFGDCCYPGSSGKNRAQAIATFGLAETGCDTCLITTCCGCCSELQVRREMQHRRGQPSRIIPMSDKRNIPREHLLTLVFLISANALRFRIFPGNIPASFAATGSEWKCIGVPQEFSLSSGECFALTSPSFGPNCTQAGLPCYNTVAPVTPGDTLAYTWDGFSQPSCASASLFFSVTYFVERNYAQGSTSCVIGDFPDPQPTNPLEFHVFSGPLVSGSCTGTSQKMTITPGQCQDITPVFPGCVNCFWVMAPGPRLHSLQSWAYGAPGCPVASYQASEALPTTLGAASTLHGKCVQLVRSGTSSTTTTAPAAGNVCFHEDTAITYQGRTHKIADIRDAACTIPHQVRTTGVAIAVRCPTQRTVLRLTDSHLLYTARGLVAASEVRPHTDILFGDLEETVQCAVESVEREQQPQTYYGLNCIQSQVLANGIKASTFGTLHQLPALWMGTAGRLLGIQWASAMGDRVAALAAWLRIL